jgi:hypothetical protein
VPNQFRTLTAEDYQGAVELLNKHEGHITGAALESGLSRSAFRDRVRRASALGMMGTSPVLPGFSIKAISTQLDKDGSKAKEWIQQRQLGETFKLPDGHIISGMSALTDPDGRVIQQWVKTKFDNAVEDVKAALVETFKVYEGHATLPEPPNVTDDKIATVYPIADHHLGLYAWAAEAGENYDLSIGEKLLRDTMAELVADAPNSETGLILNLGDFFHSDDNSNRTRKSGAALDVDGRHAKILRVGVDLLIHCIQLGLQRHQRIIVRCLPGNHDPYASLALSVALGCFFKNNPRVTIDADPSAFFWWRFGAVLIGATHGDEAKGPDMPGVMAADRPQDWGATSFRYIYLGHVHHKSVGGGEKHGAIWETFQTLSPKDAWHHTAGYRSGRSMVAITHHRERGEWKRQTVSVKGPQ